VTINLARPAVSAQAVRKSFGEHIVLDGVDLTVAEGTIFSLLGPNGAGKTTMVRIRIMPGQQRYATCTLFASRRSRLCCRVGAPRYRCR
jgi:ABC-type branched-subunit amino acid transport system ATPase component